MTEVSELLLRVKEQIAGAEAQVGRAPGSVSLVAVTKLVKLPAVMEAVMAGQRCFGENYVKEAIDKYTEVSRLISSSENSSKVKNLSLHLIGPLQSNKIRRAVGFFSVIESVASEKTLQQIHDEAVRRNITQRVLIQVNISSEASKSGCPPKDLEQLLLRAKLFGSVKIDGLMAIGTAGAIEIRRREFGELRALRDRMERSCGMSLPELSMGMSDDFVEAIEEGATIVRIGSAIFGERRAI